MQLCDAVSCKHISVNYLGVLLGCFFFPESSNQTQVRLVLINFQETFREERQKAELSSCCYIDCNHGPA